MRRNKERQRQGLEDKFIMWKQTELGLLEEILLQKVQTALSIYALNVYIYISGMQESRKINKNNIEHLIQLAQPLPWIFY